MRQYRRADASSRWSNFFLAFLCHECLSIDEELLRPVRLYSTSSTIFYQYAMVVCTIGVICLKETIKRLSVIQFFGFNLVHKAGFITPPGPISEKSKDIIHRYVATAAERFHAAIEARVPPSPRVINLNAFRVQKAAFSLEIENISS